MQREIKGQMQNKAELKKKICFYTFLHTKDLQPVANTLSTLGIIDKHNAWWRFPGMTHSLLWTVPNIRGLDNTICRFAAPQIRYFSWICFVNYPTKHHKIIKRAKALFNITERPCQILVGRRFWGFKKKKKKSTNIQMWFSSYEADLIDILDDGYINMSFTWLHFPRVNNWVKISFSWPANM